jgi:hypothetical protein
MRKRKALWVPIGLLACLVLAVQVPAAATAAPAPARPAGTATAAKAAAKSWYFDLKTKDKAPGGRATGKLTYKSQGVKKKHGQCYYARISSGSVFDVEADGYGVIAYLLYTDCRNGHAVHATAGYVAKKGHSSGLSTSTYKYATKAGVQVCLRKNGNNYYCREKR